MENRAKVAVAGDACVGKSAILTRYLFNSFPADYNFTVGIDFHSKAIRTSSGEIVRLQLWDTAGQERFRSLLPSYLRDCLAVFIVFDLTSSKSFEGIIFWMDYVKKHNSKVEIILVGNKNDAVSERRVSKADAEALAQKYQVKYFETSAASGDGIQILFETTAELVYEAFKKRMIEGGIGVNNSDDSSYTSLPRLSSEKKRKCCSS
uniref:Uncharacterized protein n=1 Tax=Panagrolaimus sp. JU765 TaxID=591449 RepID=A0AC34RK88_9BILA